MQKTIRGRGAASDDATSSPLHAGHLDVEKHDVRRERGDPLHRLLAVRRLADDLDVAGFRQQPPQPFARGLLVVHDQRAQHQRILATTSVRSSSAGAPSLKRSSALRTSRTISAAGRCLDCRSTCTSPSVAEEIAAGDAVSVTPSEQSASTSPGCEDDLDLAERLVGAPPDRRARRLEPPHRAVRADDHCGG